MGFSSLHRKVVMKAFSNVGDEVGKCWEQELITRANFESEKLLGGWQCPCSCVCAACILSFFSKFANASDFGPFSGRAGRRYGES
jgi:hypothetical protein